MEIGNVKMNKFPSRINFRYVSKVYGNLSHTHVPFALATATESEGKNGAAMKMNRRIVRKVERMNYTKTNRMPSKQRKLMRKSFGIVRCKVVIHENKPDKHFVCIRFDINSM